MSFNIFLTPEEKRKMIYWHKNSPKIKHAQLMFMRFIFAHFLLFSPKLPLMWKRASAYVLWFINRCGFDLFLFTCDFLYIKKLSCKNCVKLCFIDASDEEVEMDCLTIPLMFLGCRQCVGTSNTVHLQCAFSLFDILAYICNHGRTTVRRKILQGE